MPKFTFAKLVRDKIIENQIASGATPVFRQLTNDEYKRELVHKITEEAQEILHASPDEVALEIADVQQALDDLRDKYGLTQRDIQQAQKLKNDKNGAFKMGYYIEYVELADGDRWAEYYRDNPDRYPEIK